MIERRPIGVSLPPLLHAFVGDPVLVGAYGNACEVKRLLRREGAARVVGSKCAAGQRFSAPDGHDAHD